MQNNLFTLSFPDENWRDTSVYTFEGPHDSGVQHNLVLVVDNSVPKDAELVQYAQQQFGRSKEAMPGFELISEREYQMSSGVPAFEIVYKYSPADTITFFQKQVFLIMQGKGYVFTSTFSKKTLQTIAHEVDQIIASFRPLEN